MVGNIARIVAQFKQSWSRELEDDAIIRACEEAGHTWRERELGPVATVKMFLLQILFGNVACDFVPHLAAKDVTGSHVVIRHRAGQPVPEPVVEHAAMLAGWYSRRQHDTLCPVTVTPKKFVRKPKGALPGQVVVERERVVLVKPGNPFERE